MSAGRSPRPGLATILSGHSHHLHQQSYTALHAFHHHTTTGLSSAPYLSPSLSLPFTMEDTPITVELLTCHRRLLREEAEAYLPVLHAMGFRNISDLGFSGRRGVLFLHDRLSPDVFTNDVYRVRERLIYALSGLQIDRGALGLHASDVYPPPPHWVTGSGTAEPSSATAAVPLVPHAPFRPRSRTFSATSTIVLETPMGSPERSPRPMSDEDLEQRAEEIAELARTVPQIPSFDDTSYVPTPRRRSRPAASAPEAGAVNIQPNVSPPYSPPHKKQSTMQGTVVDMTDVKDHDKVVPLVPLFNMSGQPPTPPRSPTPRRSAVEWAPGGWPSPLSSAIANGIN